MLLVVSDIDVKSAIYLKTLRKNRWAVKLFMKWRVEIIMTGDAETKDDVSYKMYC